MMEFYLGLVLFLILNMVGGLVRALRGPTSPDRVLGVQILATISVAILLLLGQGLGLPALWDVSLIFALLASITPVTFFRFAYKPTDEGEQRDVSN